MTAPTNYKKITELTEITSLAAGDFHFVVDVSDTTDSTDGTSKKVQQQYMTAGLAPTASPTFTGTVVIPTPFTLGAVSVTPTGTELNFVDGVTSPIQTQLDAKQATITGAATTIDTEDLTVSRALVSNGSGKVAVATTTSTEIGYVNGVTSAIQTQINTKAPTASPSFTGDVGLATGGNIQVNSADPKRTMYVPASAMWPSTTSGCASLTQVESATNDVNIKTLAFDGAGSSVEHAEFGIQSPTYWDASTVTVQFIWYAAAGSGTVKWEASGLALSDDDALDTSYGTKVTVTDTLIAIGDVHISAETSAMTLAGTPVAGDWVQFKIDRDPANDTDTDDALLMGVRIRFGIKQYDDQ